MTTKNKRGQVMLESCITLAIQIVLGNFVLISCFGIFATAFINLDAYGLARASLYGASRPCTPSPHWPRLRHLNLRYECPSPGSVTVVLSFTQALSYQTKVSLR